LILGHSDGSTSSFVSKLLKATKKVKRIFGTNLEPVSEISKSLPLGVTNYTNESELHLLLGDVSHFVSADEGSSFSENFSLSISASFTSKNNTRVRSAVLRVLASLPKSFNVSVDLPDFSKNGRIQFLENARRASFTICPEGNGVDTHRLWETLYMGGVPVVTPNTLMDDLYSQLPVLVVNKWDDLSDSKFLEDEWNRITRKSWDSSLLNQSYWNNEILK
jgi:hypothetical protein